MGTRATASARGEEPGTTDDDTGARRASLAPRVFWPAAVLITAFVLFATVFRGTTTHVVDTVHGGIVDIFGWYYTVVVSLCVLFALWVGLGRFGDITLGADDVPAEFSLMSWLAMLFAAGMGIGLVFWGVAEPLTHLATPQPGAAGDAVGETAQRAMVQTFLHWGIHPWALYLVVGLSLAYAVHRKGRPVSLRWTLEPLFADRIAGWWGDAVDVVAVIGTLFGIATSLGFGVSQISSGLSFLGWIEHPGLGVRLVLIAVITSLAALSVASGVGRGIKWLSHVNMGLAGAVLLFVLFAGPTRFVLNAFVQSVGQYAQNIVALSFDTGALTGRAGADWKATWTLFYWGWWISWAPFVGVFIARISRGRTVREFVIGVLFVPTLLTLFWFSVFGGAGIHSELHGEGGVISARNTVDENSALFALLDTLPGSTVMAGAALMLIVVFFITSSDSGSCVIDMVASGGAPDPPVWSRLLWAGLTGAVAIALLVAGGARNEGLTALRTTALVTALPFSAVLIGMCLATMREFRGDRRAFRAVRRRLLEERLAERILATPAHDSTGERPGRGPGGPPAPES